MRVETVNTQRSKQSEQCIVCCVSCQDCRYKRSKHIMLQWFKCYVQMLCQYSQYKMHTHVHMFLPVTSPFSTDFQSEKSFRMLRIRAFQPYHQILYVDSVDSVDITSTLLHWNITTCINSIYIYKIWWYNWKVLILSIPNFFRIDNPLNIKEVMNQNVLAMSTLSIQAQDF